MFVDHEEILTPTKTGIDKPNELTNFLSVFNSDTNALIRQP